MEENLLPQYDVDFTELEVNRCPWPHLEEIRDLGRAVFNPPSHSWIVTSYDDTRAVLANEADYAPASDLFTEIFGDPTFMGSDNPRHAELRAIWGPYMMRGAIQKLADLVSEVCDEELAPVLERIRGGEVVDIVPHLRIIPTVLIATMIGVPREDCGLFTDWGQDMVQLFDAYSAPDAGQAEEMRQTGAAATAQLQAYCGQQIEKRRQSSDKSDLLGVLAMTDVEMTDQEKRSYVTIFLEGAQDTTTKFTTTVLATLAQYPEQRKALVENRDLVPDALEEVMRWQGPVSLDLRVVRRPGVQIGDVPIPEGAQVSVALAAANRDPSRWTNPNDFDIFRERKAHLGFGFSVHGCMGVNLARLVTTTIANKVLDAIPEYRLATDELDYGRSFLIRGARSLPLSL